MARLRITPRAERDLSRIWAFIAEAGNESAASKFIQRVLDKAEFIAEFPGAGADQSELAPGVRSFPLGNYVLYYRRIDGGIELIRVLHGARRLPDAFEDDY